MFATLERMFVIEATNLCKHGIVVYVMDMLIELLCYGSVEL